MAMLDDSHLFLIHPSNKWFITGEVSQPTIADERHYRHWTLWILAGFCFLAAGASFDSAWKVWWMRWQLERDGIRGQGTVLALRKENGEDGPLFHARFRFDASTPQGIKPFTKEREVTESSYRALRVNGPVDVFYSAADPELAKVNHTLPPEPWRDTIIALVSLIAATGSVFGARITHDRLKGLLAGAQVLPGVLNDYKSEVDSEGDHMVDLHYAFRTPGGETIYAHHRTPANDIRHIPAPEKGSTVAVLFAGQKNYLLL